jgi:hypothetical protein
MRHLTISLCFLAIAACGGKSSTANAPTNREPAVTGEAPTGPFAGGCTKAEEPTLPPGECGSRCYDQAHQLMGSNWEPDGTDDAKCAAAALVYCSEVHGNDSVTCEFIRN